MTLSHKMEVHADVLGSGVDRMVLVKLKCSFHARVQAVRGVWAGHVFSFASGLFNTGLSLCGPAHSYLWKMVQGGRAACGELFMMATI